MQDLDNSQSPLPSNDGAANRLPGTFSATSSIELAQGHRHHCYHLRRRRSIGIDLGLLAPLLNDKLMEILPAEDRAALESQPDPTALMNALTVLQLALGVVLIVAGAKLIARRVSGPRLARTWASIKAVIVVVLAIVTYPAAKQAAEQAAKIQNQQSLPQSMQDTIIIFGLIIGLIWSLALPVFMLIWFSRGKIKHEVAEWSD
jgi:hypothetical protein